MIKLNTCRHCNHVFASSKTQAFCSGSCRHSYTVTNPKPITNRDGAPLNEQSDTCNNSH